ncbi:MAG: DUF2326 domain-containing protein [Candidatus Aenigmatarchaeota archaeon]
MIYSIKCDKPSFKTIEFKPGFNVILAERTKEATRKDSRNGLGKSTLIEIIHFCLGGNKGETLNKPQLDDWTFTLDVDLAGKRYSVTRNTSNTNRIRIRGDCSNWPIKPDMHNTEEKILSVRDWNMVLGKLMFELQTYELKYAPTFRSLISYFIRYSGQSGAFLSPFQQNKSQKEWDKQVNNAFLLGIGWQHASKLQILKDRIKVLRLIKQEAESGILSNLIGNIGELEALKITLESQVFIEAEQLRNFRVHPQYSKIENEANVLTRKIHDFSNLNISDKRLFEYYELSLKEERDANPEVVSRIYEEAGIILSDSIKKRLNDVLLFHKQVVTNRKDFLTYEMERLKNEIVKREQEIQNISTTKLELMQTLQKHGALEEYTELQNKHQKIVAELNDIKIRLENLKKFEQGRSAVTVEQEILRQQATMDLTERKMQREQAILLFNSNSQTLYEAPGALSINFSETGFKFDVKIERSGSHGIGNMKIFCYDLMLAQIWSKKQLSPGFLIHDSIIFADVDERQKACALQLAAKESEKLGFQYICTLNSDSVPTRDFDSEFKFDNYVRKIFTDATEGGGLLGIRF